MATEALNYLEQVAAALNAEHHTKLRTFGYEGHDKYYVQPGYSHSSNIRCRFCNETKQSCDAR